MYVKKKKIGQKLDKFARRIMRVGNCYSRGLKSLFFFSTMNCKRKRIKLFSKRWMEISRMKFNGEARLIGKFEE